MITPPITARSISHHQSLHEVGHGDHQQGEGRQVGAEAAEQLLELGDDEDHDDGGDDKGHDDHRGRVEQGLLDLAP